MGFEGKNVLITGINGFVGSATAEYFLSEGAHVIGLVKDRNVKSRTEILNRCSIVFGDVRDIEAVRYAICKYEAEYIIHLAAQPIVRICNDDPYDAYTTNVLGTLNILEVTRCLKRSVSKIIVMTSDKSYGSHEVLPYKEESPLILGDSYSTSKAAQDMLARSYAVTYNLPVVVVRAGNLYGPGDLNLSRLIPRNISRLLFGKAPVLYTGVANYIREFIYVDNIVSAYSVLLEKGVPGEAYNVGGTKPQKIIDVITMIRDKINPSIEINLVDKNFNEIEKQYLDATKLMGLGWVPAVGLSEGLDKSIEWYKEYTKGLNISL